MPLRRFTLRSASEVEVELVDLGAAVEVIRAPDRHGTIDDITLRLDDDEARTDHARNPHLGITVGRFANRIGGARFELDGVVHELAANEGDNLLHGGADGFGRRRWEVVDTDDGVTFSLVSPDGDMGFPGTLTATVHYRLVDTTLHVDISATTDAPTVCSLSNHTYWNLGGPTETTIDDHVVTLDASTLVPVDADLIPNGEPVAAEGPFDLRAGGVLGGRIGFPLPAGYDHCFMVDGAGFRRHARIDHPTTGRRVEVWSDQPACQFYTGAFLPGTEGGGRTHDAFAALALEPQHVADAPNLPWAPSPVVRPGEPYRHHLEFRLTTDASEAS